MAKVCQTYIGTPPEDVKVWMAQTKEMFETYVLFSDTIQDAFPLPAIELMTEINDKTHYLYSKCTNAAEKNDILRLCFMYKNPDYWYLDCDATLDKLPDIEGNKPYFAEYEDKCDGFVIFGNNNRNVFKMILEGIYTRVKKGEPISLAQHRVISKQKSIISKDFFKHKGK